jgi:hypothetical protein
MAIDPVQLVKDQLEPVILLDTTIYDVIPRQVEAQIALQGLVAAEITDQQAVYVSILATAGLIPRLLIKFAQEVKKAKGGPAEVEFQDAVKFLEALQKTLAEQRKQAAKEVDPDDAVEPYRPAGYPKPDVQGFS